jgi:SAM-dependent methyltransferase
MQMDDCKSIKFSFKRSKLKERVIQQGYYSPEENENIFNKWFARGPRYLFCAVNNKYKLTQKILCDIGCAYGTNLFFCKPGSYGVEIDEHRAKFAKSIGLKVYQLDVEQDDISALPKVEAIWCSAVLEHVNCPHILLEKLRDLLFPRGLIALYVPTVPPIGLFKYVPKIGKYLSAYSDENHLNAFVPSTLKFTCEQAGFETIEVSPFYPSVLKVLNRAPVFSGLVGRIVYVGRRKG